MSKKKDDLSTKPSSLACSAPESSNKIPIIITSSSTSETEVHKVSESFSSYNRRSEMEPIHNLFEQRNREHLEGQRIHEIIERNVEQEVDQDIDIELTNIEKSGNSTRGSSRSSSIDGEFMLFGEMDDLSSHTS